MFAQQRKTLLQQTNCRSSLIIVKVHITTLQKQSNKRRPVPGESSPTLDYTDSHGRRSDDIFLRVDYSITSIKPNFFDFFAENHKSLLKIFVNLSSHTLV